LEKRVLFEWYIPPAKLSASIVMTRFEKSMMHGTTEQTLRPLNKDFYMIRGKLHFWESEYIFLQLIAIFIPFVSESRTLRYFQINKSVK